MKLQQPYIFPVTVQFEDVDAHGIVHYPNYLKYLERARSHGIKQSGYSWGKFSSSGLALAISEIHANYLRPALMEQELFVISLVTAIGKSSVKLYQSITACSPKLEELERVENDIFKLSETIFRAEIKLICVDSNSFRTKSIPLDLKQSITFANYETNLGSM
jgi:YbgC/YbaW family acyl-CoA thioester hydrolase